MDSISFCWQRQLFIISVQQLKPLEDTVEKTKILDHGPSAIANGTGTANILDTAQECKNKWRVPTPALIV